jgi:hypothetical protein
LLDSNPNTAVYLRNTRIKIVPDGNNSGIVIRSNRSLVMDSTSQIYCNSELPPPLSLPASEAKYGPHLVMLTGGNVGIKGGMLSQPQNLSTTPSLNVGIRVFMASDAKVASVTLNGSWGQAIRVFNGDGATSPPFDKCPSYFTAGCQAPQLPFEQGLPYSSELARAELLLEGMVRPPVSVINNIVVATTHAKRGVWLHWVFGAIVTGNMIRGPFDYGAVLILLCSIDGCKAYFAMAA